MVRSSKALWIICAIVIGMISDRQGQIKAARAEPFGAAFRPIEAHFDAAVTKLDSDDQRRGDPDIFAVIRLLEQTRAEILAQIPESAALLRVYVDRRFPAQIPVTANVPPSIVERMVGSVKALLKTLTQVPTLRLDLTINTVPSNARFELIPVIGNRIIVSTNDRITNVYRGEYEYVIRKSGYKDVLGAVNFIERIGDVLDCELVPTSRADEALVCRLR